ncbi:hypothetical protein AK812_SmicGene13759 [Symbiodinium microadriaticum]|uniref:Uncharacterized protein n=1 Tax=Symbiodinium microadriaticum TaxID=2951 RepID=A0A1Q9E7A6_SYMMI|nr:hypothetical protein AK812_SmicGene13759 [Symbiodinium microadriaticum]
MAISRKLAVLLALRQLHAFALRRQAENVASALARWRRFRGRAVSAASVRSEWHDAGMLGTMPDEVMEFAAAPAPETLGGDSELMPVAGVRASACAMNAPKKIETLAMKRKVGTFARANGIGKSVRRSSEVMKDQLKFDAPDLEACRRSQADAAAAAPRRRRKPAKLNRDKVLKHYVWAKDLERAMGDVSAIGRIWMPQNRIVLGREAGRALRSFLAEELRPRTPLREIAALFRHRLERGACMVESCCASDLSEGPREQTKREVDSSEELAVAWSSLALQNGLVSTQETTITANGWFRVKDRDSDSKACTYSMPATMVGTRKGPEEFFSRNDEPSGACTYSMPATVVGTRKGPEAPLAIGMGTQRSRHNEAPFAAGLSTQRSSYNEAPYSLALGTAAPSSYEAATSLATSPREAPLGLGCGTISSFHEVSAAGVAQPSFSSSALAFREAPSDFGIAAAPCQTQASQPAAAIGTRIHQGSTMEIVSCCGEGPPQAMEAPAAPSACAARTMPHALTKRASALPAAPVPTAHPLREEGARWDEVDALVRRIIGEADLPELRSNSTLDHLTVACT